MSPIGKVIGARLNSRNRTKRFVLIALISAFLILVGACESNDDDSGEAFISDSMGSDSMGMAATEATESMAEGPADVSRDSAPASNDSSEPVPMPAEMEDVSNSSLAVPTALTPADLGRDIIYRATISVHADEVAAATRKAVAIVQSTGGIVFSQTTRSAEPPRTEIIFKVHPEHFASVLDQLSGVGTLVEQVIDSDDVTEVIVDLESRIVTAEASVTRLRKFLEEATQLEDVAQLERELLDRETTLERLRGQLRTLRDQVDLATITLTIRQSPTVLPETGLQVTAWVSDDAQDPCLGVQNITVEPEDDVYLCLEVENTGTSALTDVEVSTRNLRLDLDRFRFTQGRFNRIEPGELTAAVLELPIEEGRLAGRVATRGLPIEFEVIATPVDLEGAALDEVWGETVVWVEVDTDEALPGFGDSVSGGATGVKAVFSVVLIVVGGLLPFLPFVVLIAAAIWWIRRRRRGKNQPLPPTT